MHALPVFLDLDHRNLLVVGASDKLAAGHPVLAKLKLVNGLQACAAKVSGGADIPAALAEPAKEWTPQEIALATFWVAG
jgi:hypothetical protein